MGVDDALKPAPAVSYDMREVDEGVQGCSFVATGDLTLAPSTSTNVCLHFTHLDHLETIVMDGLCCDTTGARQDRNARLYPIPPWLRHRMDVAQRVRST
jgi:hypothetical protein